LVKERTCQHEDRSTGTLPKVPNDDDDDDVYIIALAALAQKSQYRVYLVAYRRA